MKTAEQNKKIIFTIVALNYLPYGIKVRESFLKYNAGWKFVIYVVDKVPSRDIWQRLDKLRKSGIDIRFIDEIDDYFAADDFKAKYILYEFATAVKPFVFKEQKRLSILIRILFFIILSNFWKMNWIGRTLF